MMKQTKKIVLNTKGIKKDLSQELLEFLDYIENSTDEKARSAKGALVKNIHKRVQYVKNDVSAEVEFMTLLERDREKIEEGREEGRLEGRQEEKRQIILKQYNKGLPIEYIADINEIDIDFIREVVKNNTNKSK